MKKMIDREKFVLRVTPTEVLYVCKNCDKKINLSKTNMHIPAHCPNCGHILKDEKSLG